MTTEPAIPIEQLGLLVVEDNPFTTLTVRKTLESLGLTQIWFADNGQEALDLLDSENIAPDVILMDLRMPGMGGVELLSRLKGRRYSGHVIVTSGVDEETMNSVQEIATQGNISILGFLPKPLTAAALKALLENRA